MHTISEPGLLGYSSSMRWAGTLASRSTSINWYALGLRITYCTSTCSTWIYNITDSMLRMHWGYKPPAKCHGRAWLKGIKLMFIKLVPYKLIQYLAICTSSSCNTMRRKTAHSQKLQPDLQQVSFKILRTPQSSHLVGGRVRNHHAYQWSRK